MINFPPTFDIEYCKAMYPDIKKYPDNVINTQFPNFAEIHGLSTCIYDRKEVARVLLQNFVNQYSLKVLEIGPFDNAFFLGDTIKYFDVLNEIGLFERAERIHRSFNRLPKKIHYVEPTGNLTIVNEKFDIVFSSHVIEHQPDLVRHLQNVENILNDNGVYVLFIPDKRYCFDYFRPNTLIQDVLAAFLDKQSLHSAKSNIETHCVSTHNDAVRHWNGDHGSIEINQEKFDKSVEIYEKSVNGGGYVDIHAWCFIPKTFESIIKDLNKLNLIHLKLYRLCHTLLGRQEFFAVLRKV